MVVGYPHAEDTLVTFRHQEALDLECFDWGTPTYRRHGARNSNASLPTPHAPGRIRGILIFSFILYYVIYAVPLWMQSRGLVPKPACVPAFSDYYERYHLFDSDASLPLANRMGWASVLNTNWLV